MASHRCTYEFSHNLSILLSCIIDIPGTSSGSVLKFTSSFLSLECWMLGGRMSGTLSVTYATVWL